MRLSVLDQSPIRKGGNAADAVAETIRLAKAAEALGYHRYWLAEHHNTGAFAGSAPEVLIARVAAETKNIRVGSGGVMLTHYSPLKVAEQFRMLELLNPGRIDLGVGRAPGGDPRTAQALQAGPQGFGIDAFPSQVFLLKQFLDDASGRAPLPDDHPYRGIHAVPLGDTRPEMWMLGSSMNGGVFGGELGLPYSHAHFINPETSMEAVAAYRERFKPTDWCEKPRVSLGVAVLAADTEEEAQKLAASRNRWVVRLLSGHPIPILSPEEANALLLSAQEMDFLRTIEQRTFVGTPEKLKPRLLSLAERHGAEELVLLTITYDFGARMRSYELLAKEFGLTAAAQ